MSEDSTTGGADGRPPDVPGNDSAPRRAAESAPLLEVSARLYGILLFMLPASLRRRRGAEMTELFRDLYRDTWRRDGVAGVVRLWWKAVVGVAGSALAERRDATDGGRRTGSGGLEPRCRPDPGRGVLREGVVRRLLFDARLAGRGLVRDPGFAAVAVVTLALGVGAGTAIFSLVHGVVLSPLPFPEPERLVYLDHAAPGLELPGGLGLAPGLYAQYREGTASLVEMGFWWDNEATLTGDGPPERLGVARANAGLFRTLGVAASHGRTFVEEDEEPGSARVALLGHALWQRRFGSDPAVVGRVISLNSSPYTVVGVMPRGFAVPGSGAEIWTDASTVDLDVFGGFNIEGIARMAPGATVEDVRRDLHAHLARIDERFPGIGEQLESARVASRATRLHEWVVGAVERTMWVLLGTVTFVLLIAAVNVANLFLVRAEERQRETAVRVALGAGRGRLLTHFVAEGMILAALGGALGVAVATVGVEALVRTAPLSIPRLDEVAVDGTVLAVTAGVVLLLGLALGCVTALRHPAAAAEHLKEGGRSSTGGRRQVRGRQVLVAAQVAMALTLMVGAGLMLRSLWQLRDVELGFRADNVLTFRLSLPAGASSPYPTAEDAVAFHHRLLDRLRALPGVVSAGGAAVLPLGGRWWGNLVVAEDDPPEPGETPPLVWCHSVTEDYFETLGIRLLSGRRLRHGRGTEGTGTAIVNAALAEHLWPGEDPLGKRLAPTYEGMDTNWLTVVGVVETVKQESLAESPALILYTPLLTGEWGEAYRMSYALRTAVPPLELAGPVRQTVWAMDDQLPVVRLRKMADAVDEASAPTAFTMALLAIAAAVALALGAVGVYGIVSYVVRQRTGEIGVRLALGADTGDVQRMLLGQGVAVAVVGLLVGLAAAVGLGRVLDTLLYGIDPRDPVTLAATAALLLVVVLAATWLPARRAARVDPVQALRQE